MREALTRVCETIAPLDFVFGAPERFPATNIIMLPCRCMGRCGGCMIASRTAGCRLRAPKFAFTPHCTVHFFRTMTDEAWQRARRFRVRAPIRVDRIQAYVTREPQPATLVCEIPLGGG